MYMGNQREKRKLYHNLEKKIAPNMDINRIVKVCLHPQNHRNNVQE